MFLMADDLCMDAEGKNVFPPDEDDLEDIFYELREVCHPKVVCN